MPYQIKVHVSTDGPLHIGSTAQPDEVSDSMFYRRSDGALVLPGTSVAGALRSHLTRIAPAMTDHPHSKVICDALSGIQKDEPCGCVVCHLMGDINPTDTPVIEDLDTEGGTHIARASRLIINDTVIDVGKTEIRDGVSIDRNSRTSLREEQSKYDTEIVLPDTKMVICLELEDPQQKDWELLALALDEWKKGRIRLGGNTRTGPGRLVVDNVLWHSYDLHQPEHLMAYLRGEQAPESGYGVDKWHPGRVYHGDYLHTEGQVDTFIQFELNLQVDGFFLTNDVTQAAAQGFDHLSRITIPGSSLRGSLRGHAEMIARTIANLRATSEAEFLATCPAAYPVAVRQTSGQRFFLESGVSRVQNSNLPVTEKQRPDLKYFDLADRLFGNTFYGSRLFIKRGTLVGDPVWKAMDFVAIDRFTGGAADKMKYDALALWSPQFITGFYLENPEAWEVGWLFYVLRDMVDGLVSIGHRANRDFGSVQLTGTSMTLGWTHPEALQNRLHIQAEPQTEDYFNQINIEGLNALPGEWLTTWTKRWLDEVTDYRVEEAVTHLPGSDPYWSTVREPSLADLYAKEVTL